MKDEEGKDFNKASKKLGETLSYKISLCQTGLNMAQHLHLLDQIMNYHKLPTIMSEPESPLYDTDEQGDTDLLTRPKEEVKKPSLYRVLLLNDDYTPMEFVVALLRSVFNKSTEEAAEITMHVHKNGIGQCGVYTYEIAETKVAQVIDIARKNQHPLQCTMEKA